MSRCKRQIRIHTSLCNRVDLDSVSVPHNDSTTHRILTGSARTVCRAEFTWQRLAQGQRICGRGLSIAYDPP
jgi:hypothetical protein